MFPLLFRSHRRLLSAFERLQRSRNAMSTKVITYKQDLPPPGGYAEFDWSRIPQSKFPSPNRQFLALVIITCLGLIGYEKEKLRHRTENLEILDAKIALQPLLFAERDRLYLRRIRRNFEAETELMKDVPGWEVGKWYHMPVYKTLPANHWIDPTSFEYWEHSDHFEFEKWYHWWYSA